MASDNWLETEWKSIEDSLSHIWTDDVKPYFAKFGVWGAGIVKNIVYDMEQAVKAGAAVAIPLTGQALKGIFQTVGDTVKAIWGGAGSYSDKFTAIKDTLLDSVFNWGVLEPIAIKIAGPTFDALIAGFMSIVSSGMAAAI